MTICSAIRLRQTLLAASFLATLRTLVILPNILIKFSAVASTWMTIALCELGWALPGTSLCVIYHPTLLAIS